MPTVKSALVFAAVLEIATGVTLLLDPSLIAQGLFAADLSGIAVTISRVAGIALICLGVACWPGTPLTGMLTYSVAAALYLAYVGYSGGPSGKLLWPAVVAHLVLAALLTRGIARGKASGTPGVRQ